MQETTIETKACKHIFSQILRSGTSPASNFIHRVFLAINSFFRVNSRPFAV